MPLSSRARLRRAEFGARRRMMALIVTLVGLVSFAVPLVSVDMPVEHRSRWSPLAMVEGIQSGELPVGAPDAATGSEFRARAVQLLLNGFLAPYILLVIACVAILISPAEAAPTWLGGLSFVAATVEALFGHPGYQAAIYGAADGQAVHAANQTLILVVVSALLVFIAKSHELD